MHESEATAAGRHGLLRARSALQLEQLIAEFCALRSCVLRLWGDASPPDADSIRDIGRFNEAIDQAVAESVQAYAAEVERWRQIYLGVLGHDLRGPLNAITLTAQVMAYQAPEAMSASAATLTRGTRRMAVLLDSLLEYNRAGLGVGMVIEAAPGDLKTACTEELELQRSALPGAKIELTVQGDTRLNFDHSRMCEALGNLITNAVKHGLPSEPVAVRLEGDDDKVRLSVENAVVRHISDSGIERLVEPLRRGAEVSPRANRSHLGLGLFIARQIARAHGGARHRPFHVPTYLLHHDGSETSPHRGLRSARMRAGSCWAGAAIAGSGPRAWRERWRWPRRRVAGSKAPGCRKTSFWGVVLHSLRNAACIAGP